MERSPVPIVFIGASILCHSSAAIRLESRMLTDVAGAAAAMERYAGGRRTRTAAESRGDIVFGHKTLNSNLSNFIPADRWLAGQNIRAGGGREGLRRWRG